MAILSVELAIHLDSPEDEAATKPQYVTRLEVHAETSFSLATWYRGIPVFLVQREMEKSRIFKTIFLKHSVPTKAMVA